MSSVQSVVQFLLLNPRLAFGVAHHAVELLQVSPRWAPAVAGRRLTWRSASRICASVELPTWPMGIQPGAIRGPGCSVDRETHRPGRLSCRGSKMPLERGTACRRSEFLDSSGQDFFGGQAQFEKQVDSDELSLLRFHGGGRPRDFRHLDRLVIADFVLLALRRDCR